MKKIAVTGNIGCGKSYVMNLIKQYGYATLDMDEVARQVRYDMQKELFDAFACNNEQALADLVFQDKSQREKLEQMLYPKMIARMHDFFELHKSEPMVFVELALLFEKHWEIYFDAIWLIYADMQTAKQRLIKYRHYSEKEATKRILSQMPMEEKKAKSDVVLYNDAHHEIEKQLMQHLKEENQ